MMMQMQMQQQQMMMIPQFGAGFGGSAMGMNGFGFGPAVQGIHMPGAMAGRSQNMHGGGYSHPPHIAGRNNNGAGNWR